MADTQRTRAQLLVLYGDNVTGQISPQDLRDGFVTVMPTDFANPADFFVQPMPEFNTTDKNGWGWIHYSCYMDSAVVFGDVLCITPSGTWKLADVNDSGICFAHGIAMDSYASDYSTAQVLRRGLMYNSAWSGMFSGYCGRPIYLCSGSAGDLSVTETANSVRVIGHVEISAGGGGGGYLRFDPCNWTVTGT